MKVMSVWTARAMLDGTTDREDEAAWSELTGAEMLGLSVAGQVSK
jgi:hypothetical protein